VPPVFLPPDVLEKVIDGLVRNAVENTPDEGKIEVHVRKGKEKGAELVVRDYGVGIPEDCTAEDFRRLLHDPGHHGLFLEKAF
jgi:signal transduction histidine kinase